MRKNKHLSEETKQKLRLFNKGKKLSEETKLKISKTTTGMKKSSIHKENIRLSRIGKKHNPESINKMKYSHSGKNHPNFGKSLPNEIKQKIRLSHIGKTHSEETKHKLSLMNSGCKSLKWKGGISFYPYCEKFDTKRKNAVRKFFNYTCLCCGKLNNENITKRGVIELSVHHIDHDKEQGCSNKSFNLVPLCSKCHAKEQYDEEEYKAYINKTLREGFKWGIWNEQEYIEKVMY